jgi:hypothetical protein
LAPASQMYAANARRKVQASAAGFWRSPLHMHRAGTKEARPGGSPPPGAGADYLRSTARRIHAWLVRPKYSSHTLQSAVHKQELLGLGVLFFFYFKLQTRFVGVARRPLFAGCWFRLTAARRLASIVCRLQARRPVLLGLFC